MVEESKDTKEGIYSAEVISALSSIQEFQWEAANWPLVVMLPKTKYQQLDEDPTNQSEKDFWKEVFNPANVLTPESTSRYVPNFHFLFVLHSFKDSNGQEERFKAVTTSAKSFVEDPGHLINYKYHGQPCELRSKQIYPTVYFRKFYDTLSDEEKYKFPIPTIEFRKRMVKERVLNKKR